MFFLNFLVFYPFFFDLNLILKFQYFPELTGGQNDKKIMLKKFFFSKIKGLCHSFRYTFPLRTSGAIVLGGETFIDCAFETKYKVKVQNCESNFFIGRLNLIKGTFIAINFPYRMEKFTSFSTFLVSEKFQLSHHIQERERLEKKNFDFLSFSKSFRVARKNSFSLCWSTSRISSAISGFFFNPFVESRYKLYYFNRRIFKKYILNPSFQLSFKKKILRRLNFHIFRASHVPLVFPFNLFQKTAKIVSQGLKLIFFFFRIFSEKVFLFFGGFIYLA